MDSIKKDISGLSIDSLGNTCEYCQKSCILCKPRKIYFKKLLDMIGTDTFIVLWSENLDQVLGSGMIWMLDERNWTWSLADRGTKDSKKLLNHELWCWLLIH